MKSWLFLRPKIYPCISKCIVIQKNESRWKLCFISQFWVVLVIPPKPARCQFWKHWGWGKSASFQLKVGTFLPDELRILGISWVQPTEQGKRGGVVWRKRTELSLGRGTSYPMNSRAKKKIWKKVGSRATSNCVRECKEVTQGGFLDSVLESCFLFS